MAGRKGGGGRGGGKSSGGKGGNLVVASKVKDAIRSAGCRASGDLVDAVSAKVNSILKDALARCKANSRGTVRPQDL
jgi:histone H3/H4